MALQPATFTRRVQLSSFFGQIGKKNQVRIGGDYSFEDLRSSPAVVIGAFNNRWAMQMTSNLHFEFADQGDQSVIRESGPSQRIWYSTNGANGKAALDYAIVTRLLNSTTGSICCDRGWNPVLWNPGGGRVRIQPRVPQGGPPGSSTRLGGEEHADPSADLGHRWTTWPSSGCRYLRLVMNRLPSTISPRAIALGVGAHRLFLSSASNGLAHMPKCKQNRAAVCLLPRTFYQ